MKSSLFLTQPTFLNCRLTPLQFFSAIINFSLKFILTKHGHLFWNKRVNKEKPGHERWQLSHDVFKRKEEKLACNSDTEISLKL